MSVYVYTLYEMIKTITNSVCKMYTLLQLLGSAQHECHVSAVVYLISWYLVLIISPSLDF
jgi:hypothetical protein